MELYNTVGWLLTINHYTQLHKVEYAQKIK